MAERVLPEEAGREVRIGRRRWLRLLRPGIGHIVVAVILVCLVAALVGAPWIARYDPYALDLFAKNNPPSRLHWMGTDDFGRDIFSRLVYGTRYSLAMSVIVTLSSTILGIVLGGAAGFWEGGWGEVIMRATDLVMGFPALLLAMAIAAILGSNLLNAIIAASAVWWPPYVRLMRGQILAVKNDVYVEAAKAFGATDLRVLFKHVLPNSWAPLNVRITMDLGRAVVFTSSLSFIGLGAHPPLPEWGTMLAESRKFILSAWWYPTFPGLAIALTVLAFSLLGDIVDEILRPQVQG
jgi:peptide/nickel transport system permease protein